jgi:4'-phosphopantetheinyl transferase
MRMVPSRRSLGLSIPLVPARPQDDNRADRQAFRILAGGALGRGSDTMLVEVFIVPTEPVSARAVELLSAEERLRLSQMRSDAARSGFVSLRAALRSILSQRLGCPPQSVAVAVAPGGQPRAPGSGWHVSLSHASAGGVVALSRDGPIGVDMEADRQIPDALAIARGLFHPTEWAWIARHRDDARSAAFLRVWVRKEAVVKACGTGLAARLDTWSVLAAADHADPHVDVELRGTSWRVRDLDGPSAHRLALATECLDGDIQLCGLPPRFAPR